MASSDTSGGDVSLLTVASGTKAAVVATATAAPHAPPVSPDGSDVDKAKARVLSQLLLLLSAAPDAGGADGDEREAAWELLRLPHAAQKQVVQALFVLQPALLSDFARVLQFFVRVMVEAHASSHDSDVGGNDAGDARCSWARNGRVCCYETSPADASANANANANSSSSSEAATRFRLPPDFLACVVDAYGSVQRSKCEEVWHGDHMAYRCRTCGLSDSSCMCLGCFDPDDHDGHDYRVYRCSSGGCCDCGDPLAWRPEGFCKKHSAAPAATPALGAGTPVGGARMGALERDVVTLLVRRTVGFCVNVLREVHLFCLRPGGAYDSDPFYPRRSLPKTGRRRHCFPDGTQVYLDRVQQALAWLQMLATSCVGYRDVLIGIFFEPLPSDFQLEPPLAAAAGGGDSEPGRAISDGGSNLLILDVFLQAGVLLPVETCDALGVLYLKLLFDQAFKQAYTCHFVEWYPYFIELYLTASDENNDDGMRSLSRFIDRLFCQLFHSTAQLRELERLFAAARHRFRQPLGAAADAASSRHAASCVERLMLFLLEKLNALFRSAARVETLPGPPPTTTRQATPDNATTTATTTAPLLLQVIDCGRSVFKKRVYARLCSDLRTLLVHPQVAADAVLHSFSPSGRDNALVLDRHSVYGELIETFRVLQQMDLQTRHVSHHIEYESLNWTFAFVVDYEVNLLLHAFLAGIPLCVATAATDDDTSSAALATALVRPVRDAVVSWTQESGYPAWRPPVEPTSKAETARGLVDYYDAVAASQQQEPTKRSFHLPLHHMYASLLHAVSLALCPHDALEFALGLVAFPLRVSFFTREVKAGLWVRNGNAMWQQLTHYYSKHWRFYGVHSDLFLCQLGALLAPRGGFTRVFLRHFPVDLRSSAVFTLARRATSDDARPQRLADVRRELDAAEEMLRLLLQILLAPVKLATSVALAESLAYLLEREMKHWLSLGPFARSEAITRVDAKIVELAKLLPEHPWHRLEEEEILAQVLETVGVYEEAGAGSGAAMGGATTGGGVLHLGLKMSGVWRLKPALWPTISPLFECFTPSEAQQCEQNVRANLPKARMAVTATPPVSDTSVLAVPILPGLPPAALQRHVELAAKVFGSPALLSALFIVLANWRARRDGIGGSAGDRDATTETLLLTALQCVFVGVQLLEPPAEAESEALRTFNASKHPLVPGNAAGASVDDVACCFADELSFITNLCASVPVGDDDSSLTLLSLLLELAAADAPLEDAKALAQQILVAASAKSSLCRARVDESRASARVASGVPGDGADTVDTMQRSSEGRESSAKEAARRRQQLILEKMRSKQLQFLSSHGEPRDGDTLNSEDGHRTRVDCGDSDDSDDSNDIARHDNDSDDDDDDDDDEWGFPTGQIDLQLYLDHVSSAIAVRCEHEKKLQERRQRQRRSARRRRSSGDSAGSFRSSMTPSLGGDEADDDAEECALCRMPCERLDAPSSFGYVGMVVPTRIPQRLREQGVLAPPPLPSVRVVRSRAREDASTVRLSDAVVWSCGHPLHHDCLKSYVSSLWKPKRQREPATGGDERLLSERDVEFQCPICRRLSNCLVPSVPPPGALGRPSQSSDDDALDGNAKASNDADAQEARVFVQWLSAHMSFQDDHPQVQRRKSRSMSFLRSRLNASAAERERLGAVERGVDRFYHAITLRCLRAAMQLPLLLDATVIDESQVDTEIEDASCALGVQLPAWQLLVHSLEVQVALVALERQDDSADKQRLQSMRRLADVAVAACAMSAQNALSWSFIDAPYDAKFDVVVGKLNAILFGHQVLFEEDDDDAVASDDDDNDTTRTGAAPVLCHADLFSFFVARMVWRRGMLSSSSLSSVSAIEELVSEAFFLARVLVTAQLLQSLCCVVVQSAAAPDDDTIVADSSKSDDNDSSGGGSFSQVQSLRDAYRWVARLLSRCRLVGSSATAAPPKWSSVEQDVSAMCLPLVKRIVLLMEILLPPASPDSGANDPCAVCDGVFSDALPPELAKSAGASTTELETYLRRLHLPPLRLFFRVQMFAPDQRGLCELWGAQLEATAAVLRQRAPQAGASLASRWFGSRGLRTGAAAGTGTEPDRRGPRRLLIDLPRIYMSLFIAYSDKPRGVCQQCGQAPQHPAVCLLCGVVLCCYSPCCESARGNVGECSQHAQTCGLGLGAFLLLRACTVVLFLGNERRCVWGSVYVDKNGEEDPYLRRGKTLYLDEGRVRALETLLLSHGFSQNTAILTNTSRRDGRRY
ncbi:hypothetical protein PybrP1_008093 [[Pythium] brassicae (nom. inval.)]|nr:hypothetical protein PybrP1_008093 [[Pythium] brassicae (nom. inval.)]